MRWLADECVDATLVFGLRNAGHDVVYAAESAPSTRDTHILKLATQDGRILLTEDKDFGELIIRRRNPVAAIVLVRIRSNRRHLKWPRLEETIATYGDALIGHYTVIEEARLRRRAVET